MKNIFLKSLFFLIFTGAAIFSLPSSVLAANNAQYVSQICPPSNMAVGQTTNVSVTMKNTGTAAWTAANNYRLGSLNPPDNDTWGLGRVNLGSSVSPNANYTFGFTATAPSTAGTYNFQWKMLRENVEWFGDNTPNCSVTVGNPPSAPTSLSASCPAPGKQASFSWNTSTGATRYQLRINDQANSWSCSNTGDACLNSLTGTSYTSSSTPGSSYGWWMEACNAYGCSSSAAGSPSPFTCNVLPAPQSLLATCNSSTSVNLIWDAVSGAESYQVRINKDPQTDWMGPGDLNPVPSTTNTTQPITTGVNYTWSVQGMAPGESYPYSGNRGDGPNFTCTTPAPSGTISASPNPCTIPWASSQCTSTISWTTTNASNVSVKVGSSTFSSGIASGSQDANWISSSGATFDLYSGSTKLASTTVRGDLAPSPIPTSVPTPVPTSAPTPINLNCPIDQRQIRTNSGLLSAIDAGTAPTRYSTTGLCILGPQAAIPQFSIPTYPKIKSLYFDQLKANAAVYKKKTITGNATHGNLTSTLAGETTDVIIHISPTETENGSLDISGNFGAGFSKTAVIFINGDLNIGQNISYGENNSDRGLVFIVQGDVNIDESVTKINAFIITYGQLCSARVSGSCPSSVLTSQLIINGSVVTLSQDLSDTPKFVRNTTNNNTPAEKIIFQPKYLIILKDIFSRDLTVWKEIQ